MPDDTDVPIGARIADQRKRAGLTQHGLAGRIPYSYSTLRHVESGHRRPTPDLVAAVARALHIDIETLTGPPVPSLLPAHVAPLIRPIREALDLYDLPADAGLRPRPTAVLVAEAEAACVGVRQGRLRQVAAALPALLAELTNVCLERPSGEAWRALASVYRTAHDVTTKLGSYDLAARSLDRMGWAATHAGDPVLCAIRQYKRALGYRSSGSDHGIGLRMVRAGHGILSAAEPGMERSAVEGQLHLGAAVIAARAADLSATETHLAEAAEIAQRTGEVGRVHWLSFGPANVASHEVYARLALRQYGQALVVARALRPPRGWAPSRRAAALVDRAWAEMETGRTAASLVSLQAARRLAPQQTRLHPRVAQTVRGLRAVRRRTPDDLNLLAAWVGV
ncbi:helix-turn-helix domain-containing protein [Streptomyces sp. 796.1]|uniref:helix-turn-helix domain-containing protein n=1 Tax=Streptomyces sp. 796.1 TaxID=3163029 RepID=UPI0039C96A55